MTSEPKTIKVIPGGEIDQLLGDAGTTPVLLDRRGVYYRLTIEQDDDIWAGYDPAAALKVLGETAGSWSDIDADALIADVYRWREQGTRPDAQP